MDQEKFDKARQLKEQIKYKTKQINMIDGLLRSKLSKTVEVRGYNGMVAYLSGFT